MLCDLLALRRPLRCGLGGRFFLIARLLGAFFLVVLDLARAGLRVGGLFGDVREQLVRLLFLCERLVE